MNVQKIKDYIIKKYPDSCLAYNYTSYEDYYDKFEDSLIEECVKFFYYEKLNWCGCGDPVTTKKVVRDFLRILNAIYIANTNDFQFKYQTTRKLMMARFGVESVYDNELLLCLAYTMDAAGFTEHESSIGGAWISEEGLMFLWLLEQDEELMEESE